MIYYLLFIIVLFLTSRKGAKNPFNPFVAKEAKSASGLYLAADTLKSIDHPRQNFT